MLLEGEWWRRACRRRSPPTPKHPPSPTPYSSPPRTSKSKRDVTPILPTRGRHPPTHSPPHPLMLWRGRSRGSTTGSVTRCRPTCSSWAGPCVAYGMRGRRQQWQRIPPLLPGREERSFRQRRGSCPLGRLGGERLRLWDGVSNSHCQCLLDPHPVWGQREQSPPLLYPHPALDPLWASRLQLEVVVGLVKPLH